MEIDTLKLKAFIGLFVLLKYGKNTLQSRGKECLKRLPCQISAAKFASNLTVINLNRQTHRQTVKKLTQY